MRTNLKILRIKQGMTQDEFSEVLETSRANYSNIERGDNEGSLKFWSNLQKAFNVPDEEMYKLIKKEEEK